MSEILGLDYSILYTLMTQLRSEALNAVMTFITHLGDGGLLWIAIALVCLLRRKTRRCGVTMLTALLAGVLIGNLAIKSLVARPRPFLTFPELIPLIEQGGFSFPSGHSLSSFAAATVIFLFCKRAGVLAYLGAALIAFSRLYVCVHYPTDVLCGALLGVVIGLICSKLVPYVIDRHHYSKIRSKRSPSDE